MSPKNKHQNIKSVGRKVNHLSPRSLPKYTEESNFKSQERTYGPQQNQKDEHVKTSEKEVYETQIQNLMCQIKTLN